MALDRYARAGVWCRSVFQIACVGCVYTSYAAMRTQTDAMNDRRALARVSFVRWFASRICANWRGVAVWVILLRKLPRFEQAARGPAAHEP